jgi:hypothetical protein
MRHRQPDCTWSVPLDIQAVRAWVEWRDFEVPVLSLSHEASAYEKMGRLQKAQLIRAAMRKEAL